MSNKITDLLESGKSFTSWDEIKSEIKRTLQESKKLDESVEDIYNKVKQKYSEPMDISKEDIKTIIYGFAIFGA